MSRDWKSLLDMNNPRTKISTPLFAAFSQRGWVCELRVGKVGDDYRIFVGRHDEETYERYMGWKAAYLYAATEADLQADIKQAIEDVDAFMKRIESHEPSNHC